MGITMAGIVISVAATVGFGLPGPAWLRAVAAVAVAVVAVAVVLVAAIKLGTAQGSRGAVARFADWMTGGSQS